MNGEPCPRNARSQLRGIALHSIQGASRSALTRIEFLFAGSQRSRETSLRKRAGGISAGIARRLLSLRQHSMPARGKTQKQRYPAASQCRGLRSKRMGTAEANAFQH
eukprot:657870-Rhodomonas_salina.1